MVMQNIKLRHQDSVKKSIRIIVKIQSWKFIASLKEKIIQPKIKLDLEADLIKIKNYKK